MFAETSSITGGESVPVEQELPPGAVRCTVCARPFAQFDANPTCSSCDEVIRRLAGRGLLTKQAARVLMPRMANSDAVRSREYRARKQAEATTVARRKREIALAVRRFRVRCNQKAGQSVTPGPTRYGVGGETYAWLGKLAPAKEVDVSKLPPVPAGVFNDRVREQKRKPVKKGRTCSRPDCGRSLDLGRHKTRCPTHDSVTCSCPLVCRKCRDADTQAARETQREHEEFGTPEEIAAQLKETKSADELDAELADEDEK